MQKVELLSPAGNFEKLKTAFYYGADAVYVGGKNLSLRAQADNFTNEELEEATAYAHNLGKKIYVTVNIFAHNRDLDLAEEFIAFLEKIGVDGAIMSDPGLISLALTKYPKLPVHISTQANITNKYIAEFWHKQGAERVVLARELSLKEIKDIKEYNPTLELEAFIHGALCYSYSGQCLFSSVLGGRSGNRGRCAQPCRLSYAICDNKKKEFCNYLYNESLYQI